MNKTLNLPVLGSLPPVVKRFLTRALIIFVCWKLLYHLVLFPIRVPDKALTSFTAQSASWLYTNLMNEKMVVMQEKVSPENIPYIAVSTAGKKLVAISDSCNGLELIVLFVGFLFCFPISWKRLLPFAVAGTLGIIILNAFRCYGLTWMYMNNYSLADFFHKYLFKMVIYGIIFFAWVRYSKRYFDAQA